PSPFPAKPRITGGSKPKQLDASQPRSRRLRKSITTVLPGSGHAHFHVAFRALSPRGGPIRAGWNRTAAASVQTSARAISLPMLDSPGCLDGQRLLNTAHVVSSEENTVRHARYCISL